MVTEDVPTREALLATISGIPPLRHTHARPPVPDHLTCVPCGSWRQCVNRSGSHKAVSVLTVATFRVARLTSQTRKLWLVDVATKRNASVTLLRFFSFDFSLFFLACVSFHSIFPLFC